MQRILDLGSSHHKRMRNAIQGFALAFGSSFRKRFQRARKKLSPNGMNSFLLSRALNTPCVFSSLCQARKTRQKNVFSEEKRYIRHFLYSFRYIHWPAFFGCLISYFASLFCSDQERSIFAVAAENLEALWLQAARIVDNSQIESVRFATANFAEHCVQEVCSLHCATCQLSMPTFFIIR